MPYKREDHPGSSVPRMYRQLKQLQAIGGGFGSLFEVGKGRGMWEQELK
jgi:hypothetical protein